MNDKTEKKATRRYIGTVVPFIEVITLVDGQHYHTKPICQSDNQRTNRA